MIRQVPSNKLLQTKLLPIFSVTLLDQIAITIGFPVLIFLCFDVHSALFPAAASHMTRSFWFGICSGLPHFIAIATTPLLGYISDHFGRKPILILGATSALLLCAFTSLSIFFAAISLLVIGSIMAGFCARTEPVALAAVSDLSDPSNKIINMGYLQLCVSIGAFVGPLVGGYFAQRFLFPQLNFSLPYLIGIIVASLTLIFTIKYFRESYRPPEIKSGKIAWRKLLNPNVLQISVILILTQISWRTYYQFVPPLLKLNFHYSATTIGVFMALIAAWLSLATAFGVKWLSNFFTIPQIIKHSCYVEITGLMLIITSCFLPSTQLTQWLIWISALPVAMADVTIFCALTALYSQAVSPHDQGKVMGLCFIIVSTVWTLTGLLGGLLAGINVILPILFTPLPVALALFACSKRMLIAR